MQDIPPFLQEPEKKSNKGRWIFYVILLAVIGVLYFTLWDEYGYLIFKRTISAEERAMHKTAYDYLQKKDFKSAKQQCQQVIAKYPKNTGCLDILSITEFLEGNYKLAEEYATKAIKVPSIPSPYPYYHRAQAREKLSKDLGALQDFKKAGKIGGIQTDAYYQAGRISQEKFKDFWGAAKYYKLYLQDHKDNNYVTHLVAEIYKDEIGDTQQALDILNSFISRNKKLEPYIYYLRADIYRESGDNIKAIEDYQKAIKLNPKNGSYYNKMAWAYRDIKQYDKAIAAFNKAEKVEPGFGYAYNNLGVLYQKLGKQKLAIESFTKAVALRPDNYEAYNARATSYAYIGDYANAKKDLQICLKNKDVRPVDVYNIGVVYYFMKDFTSAKREYVKAINMNPRFSWAHLESGIMSLFLDDIPEASKEILTYFELGDSGDIKVNFSKMFEKGYDNLPSKSKGTREQFEDARMFLMERMDDEEGLLKAEEAVKRHPNNPYFYMVLAKVQEQLGQDPTAANTKAKEIDSSSVSTIKNLYAGSMFFGTAGIPKKLEKLQQAYPDFALWYLWNLKYEPDTEKAKVLKEKIVSLNPFVSSAYFLMAYKYYYEERYQEALEELNKAIEINPYYSYAYLLRALTNAQLGNKAETKSDYSKFRRISNEAMYGADIIPVITN